MTLYADQSVVLTSRFSYIRALLEQTANHEYREYNLIGRPRVLSIDQRDNSKSFGTHAFAEQVCASTEKIQELRLKIYSFAT